MNTDTQQSQAEQKYENTTRAYEKGENKHVTKYIPLPIIPGNPVRTSIYDSRVPSHIEIPGTN